MELEHTASLSLSQHTTELNLPEGFPSPKKEEKKFFFLLKQKKFLCLAQTPAHGILCLQDPLVSSSALNTGVLNLVLKQHKVPLPRPSKGQNPGFQRDLGSFTPRQCSWNPVGLSWREEPPDSDSAAEGGTASSAREGLINDH